LNFVFGIIVFINQLFYFHYQKTIHKIESIFIV